MTYPIIDDVRTEGFSPLNYTDSRVQTAIDESVAFLELTTQRSFIPKTKTIHVSGYGEQTVLFLDEPIVSITSVAIEDQFGGLSTVDSTSFKVFNRHLSEDLLDPDDREAPRIEFVSGHLDIFGQGFWPLGVQNVKIVGKFGYTDRHPTDAAGNPDGVTPPLIARVVLRLVSRFIERENDIGEREDRLHRFRIVSERSGDRSLSLSKHPVGGSLTGDPDIDSILVRYRRPLRFGRAGGSHRTIKKRTRY